MFDFIVEIPGPFFLLIFSLISGTIITFAKLWVKSFDKSNYYRFPSVDQFNYIDIATLIGGRNAVIRTVLFNMYNKKAIDITGKGRRTLIGKTFKHFTFENNIESEIYNYIDSTKKPSDFFNDTKLLCKIDRPIIKIYKKLENMHLILHQEVNKKAKQATIVAGSIILLMGGTKLFFGIQRNKPVIFLVLLLIISLISLLVVLKPTSKYRQSALSKRFIKRLEEHYSWMVNDLKNGKGFIDYNPAISYAIWGGAAIAGILFFKTFKNAFYEGSIGGCSGNSWDCGDCSDGGCSGGCGGGCGGCGG